MRAGTKPARRQGRIDLRQISAAPIVFEIVCGCRHFRSENGDELSAVEAWNTHALEAGHEDGWELFRT